MLEPLSIMPCNIAFMTWSGSSLPTLMISLLAQRNGLITSKTFVLSSFDVGNTYLLEPPQVCLIRDGWLLVGIHRFPIGYHY
nr:hypothetical protein Q903MT_gene2280 [Picea sitchensis]